MSISIHFLKYHLKFIGLVSFLLTLFTLSGNAGERTLIQLRDFSTTEVKSGGFSLPSDGTIHITALGSGNSSDDFLDAYGWIINADTRELVWQMDRNNTRRDKDDRKFDGNLQLKKGNYEVNFAAYAFSYHSPFVNFSYNIDRRNMRNDNRRGRGFFEWLGDLFGDDNESSWRERSKNWGIDLAVDERAGDVTTFIPPREFSHILFKRVKLGEREHILQSFHLNQPLTVRIYALGEKDNDRHLADYGWIVNDKTRQRVWEMNRADVQYAGGAEKNVKFDNSLHLDAGDYTIYFTTDDSHSFVDWNAAPPNDPLNYGITIIGMNEEASKDFTLTSTSNTEKDVIVQLTEVRNDETRSASFGLKHETSIRIYAIGERSNSSRQMADYGWIINARTREKVWTMEADETEPAGGADKNRMVDKIITLPKGSYTVFYQSDDSHAYNQWNDSPPFDPEHWGITLYGAGDHFNVNDIERNISPKEEGVIAQIVQVGDNANEVRSFHLDKATHVRIYAIGEGQNHEMYDYGWIEDAASGKTVWEMTYSMTFYAGGGRKNRLVQTTLILDRGDYRLHYVSDDSHSFNHWNTDPPDDPTMWGITLYRGE